MDRAIFIELLLKEIEILKAEYQKERQWTDRQALCDSLLNTIVRLYDLIKEVSFS